MLIKFCFIARANKILNLMYLGFLLMQLIRSNPFFNIFARNLKKVVKI
ncbi:hypothetical protein BBU29805_E06 (plasmid) [Borreliella burgdorferi 29805]|nr:hypothetical protein BBU29805_E06 [Borreliella burgdorferi 29805]